MISWDYPIIHFLGWQLRNMQRISKYIQKTYNKKVMIAETSYCYTSEDGDGSGNSLVGTDDIVKGYPATVQSQATMVRDVCAAANEAGLEGVFYWEGTWIPVGPATADNSLFGKITAAAGQAAMLPDYVLMTLVYIMVDVLGITRQCLILQVIHYHP